MEKNVYATNRAGYIKAPNTNGDKSPSATATVAKTNGDLRSGK